MYCSECGAQAVAENQSFCAECGTELSSAQAPSHAQIEVDGGDQVTLVQPVTETLAPPPQYSAIPPTLPPGIANPLLGPPLHQKSHYATWLRRAAAYLIDACFLWLIGGLLFVAAAAVMAQNFDSAESAISTLLISFLALELAIVVGSLFYAFFAYARSLPRRGQSLGKQALGIRVERLDEQPLRTTTFFPRVLLTVFIGAITLGLFYLADYFWPLVDQRRQALHDKIASTVVVDLRSPEASSKPEPIASFAPIMIAAIISLAIGIGGFALGNQMMQDAANDAVDYVDQSLQESIDDSAGDSYSSSDDGSGFDDETGGDDLSSDPDSGVDPDSVGDDPIPPDDTTSSPGSGSSSGSSVNSEVPEFDGYIAQLSSFKRLINAQNQRDELIANGIDARILRSNDIAELRPNWWVVYAGPFDTKSEAARVARSADRNGAPGAFARPATVR